MKVTLINYTAEAAELLIFTKSTRLNMSPSLLETIKGWSREKKEAELAYMAETIPSSWEFVDYVFLVEGVSRAYTHQQVRNRCGVYAQQSLRVVDASSFSFVWPSRIGERGEARGILGDIIARVGVAYGQLRGLGVAPEDARSILPTNIATNIVCKFDLRTMADIARSRTGGRTQGEHIDVANAMIDRVLEVHPWARLFLFPRSRNHYAEIEAFAEREYAGDLRKKGELLKIVDKMRQER